MHPKPIRNYKIFSKGQFSYHSLFLFVIFGFNGCNQSDQKSLNSNSTVAKSITENLNENIQAQQLEDLSSIVHPLPTGRYTISKSEVGNFGSGTFRFSVHTIDVPQEGIMMLNVAVRNETTQPQEFWYAFDSRENFYMVDNLGRQHSAALLNFQDLKIAGQSPSSYLVKIEPMKAITGTISFSFDSARVSTIDLFSPKRARQAEFSIKDIYVREANRTLLNSTPKFLSDTN